MNTIDFPQQKELEAAISDLRVFMDITAVSLHEANTAGRSGYILTIILEEDSDQIACEMCDWADKIFERYLEITYRIINIRDLIDYIKHGNLYYIKWYLAGVRLFKNEEFEVKIKDEIPKAKDLLEKAIKKINGHISKTEALQRGAQHYIGTNNHQLALYTIHQTISLLFGISRELVMGKLQLNSNIFNQQEGIKEFAPLFANLFDRNNNQDIQIAELLHKAYRDFPYYGKMKIKKESVTIAHKKMQRMYKEVKKVYKEQLSYCEEKLSTFEEPLVNETATEVVTIDNENKISGIITSYIKTSAIYCFGKSESMPSQNSAFFHKEENKNMSTHFYLLVLEEEHKENAVHDLADIIKSKTKGRCTATLLIHNVTELKTKQSDQQYFFWKVLQDGQLLYQNKEASPALNFEEQPKRNLKSAKNYLRNRNVIVNTISEWQSDYDWSPYSPLKGVILHHAVEQTCLALIRLFLGYTPNHFSLSYLLDICKHFSPQTGEYFPRRTEQDMQLFKILSQSTWTLRYSGDDNVDYQDMDLLQTRCNEFIDHADVIVRKELERIQSQDIV
ncbi:hypothetical protein FNW52_19470 [Flavobacterium sp. ZT3R18]|uniref:hypothetical protein n=1 Tax=Flavobacterium sp. ZT3R18 TaxID=2594429 RepID=UPI001179A6E8|nr:hypothetical protein [Flavobacterium sp. ZT3R18]TRX30895.1 hypothetical protein FNW52_19470 [Flavobacterium sp. ZT3R18]